MGGLFVLKIEDKDINYIRNMFDKSNIEYSENGIRANLDYWGNNKESLFDFFNEKNIEMINYRYLFKVEYDKGYSRDELLESIHFVFELLGRETTMRNKDYLTIDSSIFNGRNAVEYCALGYIVEQTIYFILRRSKSIVELDYSMDIYSIMVDYLNLTLKNYYFKSQKNVLNKNKTIVDNLVAILNAMSIENNKSYQKEIDSITEKLKSKHYTATWVLSLNPIDYLTSSHGNSWTSCHSIRDDGCYRAGVLGYMNDKNTAVLFCISKDDDVEEIPDKINRILLHFDSKKNAVILSRPYPNKDIMDDKIISVSKYIYKLFGYETMEVLNDKNCTTYVYYDDDFLGYQDINNYSNECRIAYTINNPDSDIFEFFIGKPSCCLMCGNDRCDSNNGDLLCSSCNGDEELFECECCGSQYPEDEIHFIENAYFSGYVCDGCLENDFTWVEDLEEYIPSDDAYYCESNYLYYSRDYACDNLIEIDGSFYLDNDNGIGYDEYEEEWHTMDYFNDDESYYEYTHRDFIRIDTLETFKASIENLGFDIVSFNDTYGTHFYDDDNTHDTHSYDDTHDTHSYDDEGVNNDNN